MWIPTKLYEALPALYVTIGVSITLGAVYIGISDETMLGYLILGAACVMAGIFVKSLRSKARSNRDQPQA